MNKQLDHGTLKRRRFPIGQDRCSGIAVRMCCTKSLSLTGETCNGSSGQFRERRVDSGGVCTITLSWTVLRIALCTRLWASLCHEDLPDTRIGEYSTSRGTVMSRVVPWALRDAE